MPKFYFIEEHSGRIHRHRWWIAQFIHIIFLSERVKGWTLRKREQF